MEVPTQTIVNKKNIGLGVAAVIAIVLFLIVNPFSWNDAGNRTVVERTTGHRSRNGPRVPWMSSQYARLVGSTTPGRSVALVRFMPGPSTLAVAM